MLTKKTETLVPSFPKISKNMGLTCGGLVLFQLCSNGNYSLNSKTIEEIRTELNISESENIDIMKLMSFLITNNFNATLLIKKNSFGTSGLQSDIKILKNKKLLSNKQENYLSNLIFIITSGMYEEIEVISSKQLNSLLENEYVVVLILNASIFSDGKYTGQHLVLLIGKDENNYFFQGETIFKKNKDLVIQAMNATKIKSFIKVAKHGN